MVRPADTDETGCDCPCHTGGSVFHVVSCCGSLLTFPLWRQEPRDSECGDGHPDLLPRLDAHVPRRPDVPL